MTKTSEFFFSILQGVLILKKKFPFDFRIRVVKTTFLKKKSTNFCFSFRYNTFAVNNKSESKFLLCLLMF